MPVIDLGRAELPTGYSSLLPSWTEKWRKKGIDLFTQIGYPTRKTEDWRYTNIRPLLKERYELPLSASTSPSTIDPETLSRVKRDDQYNVVFLNGVHAPGLSDSSNESTDAVILSIEEGARYHAGKMKEIIEAFTVRNAFSAMNLALFGRGAFVYVPKNTQASRPVHLIHLATTSGFIHCHRHMIYQEEASRLRLTETYLSSGDGEMNYFTNASTDILLETGASLSYSKSCAESGKAYHFSAVRVNQRRSSVFRSLTGLTGGKLTRSEMEIHLNEPEAACELSGAYALAGQDHVDNHIRVFHHVESTTSDQLYKGILKGRSRGGFDGTVTVEKNASLSRSSQLNKNLLLSEGAVANARPQLEIWNDDVQCTHGATVGEIEEEELFYFLSRGIPRSEAERMLCSGFLEEAIRRGEDPTSRERMRLLLYKRFFEGSPCLNH